MKLKELARFGELKGSGENGPVTTRKIINLENMIAAINMQPGVSAKEVAIYLGWSDDVSALKVSRALVQHSHTLKPKVKVVKQDYRNRWYPINYRLSTDPKLTPVQSLEVDDVVAREAPLQWPQPNPFLVELERRAITYAWAHPSSVEILKNFVEACKKEND